MLMRDPVLYRIKHAHHHAQVMNGAFTRCMIWPHGQSDSIEQVTHSICTLEFVPHRELYDWLIESLKFFHRVNMNLARATSANGDEQRKFLQLVNEKYVDGWDDPRSCHDLRVASPCYTPDPSVIFATGWIAKREY